VSLVGLLRQQVDQLGALHVVERVHIDSQSGGHRFDVQAKGGEQLQEAHLLAGHGIGERGTGVVALRPTASLQEAQAALLRHSGHSRPLLGLGARGGVVRGARLEGIHLILWYYASCSWLLLLILLLPLSLAAPLSLLLPLFRCQLLATPLLPLIIAIIRLGAIVLPIPILLPSIGLLPLLLLLLSLAALLPPLPLLLAQPLPLLPLLLGQVIVPPLLPSSLGHVVLLLALAVPLVSLVIGVGQLGDRRRWFRRAFQLVLAFATRRVLPTAQSRGQGYIIDFDIDPIPFGKHRMSYATGCKHGAHIVQGGSQGATHLVDVVPLLGRYGGPYIIRSHLGFIEEPLEHKKGSCLGEN